jgi:DNA polymerase-1
MYSSKGINTSTVFGFLLALDEILKKQKPTHIAAAFDSSKPTFRHEMYAQYKANRQAAPEEIHNSVPIIKKILNLMNIEIFECPGYEADDIIGTVAKKAAQNGFKVFMVTPDKDFCQLVDENISIYKPKKSGNEVEILGIEEVKLKFGINGPDQVIDILALWGDASDNVPGVPGVGEKTAQKLIAEFSSVENILNNLDKLSAKQQISFKENLAELHLSKKLVTIETSVPLEFNEEKLILKKMKENELKEYFNELNFKSFIVKFFGASNDPPAPKKDYEQGNLFSAPAIGHDAIGEVVNYETVNTIKHNYKVLESENEVSAFIDILKTKNEFCFDTETTGLDPHNDSLIGISISFLPHEAFYIPLDIDKTKSTELLKGLKPVFENADILKIGQNLKFDILFLKNYNIDVKGKLFDTMLAHYILQAEQNHKMDNLSMKYLNYKPIAIEELIGNKGSGQLNMKAVDLKIIGEYSCEDADVTFQLKNVLETELQKFGFNDLYYNLESKLLNVLVDVELCGFKIDLEYLNKYSIALRNDIKSTELEIYNLAGGEFNIASPKQLGIILFEKLKISDEAKLTKTKQYSTNEETLQSLINKHPIVNKILEYRGLTKLLSTYVEALPRLVNKHTGKVHTSFNQSLAVTGRLSSNNPNLQNIPIRDARGREIRNAFIPSSSENILLSADYSQIELRLMAHFSKDENMIDAFNKNQDIHTSTASKVFKVKLEDVSKEQRSKAKTANFGIIYGISAFGLSQRMGIPRNEANELIGEYFNTFPGVRKYMTEIILYAKQNGYVETLMKRRRYLPEINSKNVHIRGMAERNAINSPIQGTAADIIKLAMINVYEEFKNKNLKSNMILQVHDELVFDVFKPELEVVKQIVKSKMENVVNLSVPLVIEMGEGNTWLEAH